jgi:hypothetical protein
MLERRCRNLERLLRSHKLRGEVSKRFVRTLHRLHQWQDEHIGTPYKTEFNGVPLGKAQVVCDGARLSRYPLSGKRLRCVASGRQHL